MPTSHWETIIERANLEASEHALLAVCRVEEQGDVIFLRVPDGLVVPSPMWEKLAMASQDYQRSLKQSRRFPTVNDLQAVVSDVDWLWENWIPKGLPSMLVGASGVGKTMLPYQFIKVVVTGGTWPDGSRQEPGTVVLVETENAQAVMVKRFREMQIPMDRVYIPNFDDDLLGQADLRRKDHQEHLRQLCKDVRPSLVGIDSIGGAQSKGENQIEDARPIMQFLATLARDNHCASLASHHLKKRGDGFENAPLNIDHVRGSTGFVAYTRSLLALSKQKGVLKLEILKSNVAPIGEPLVVKFETNPAGNVIGVSFGKSQSAVTQPTTVERCADWLRATLASEGAQAPKTIIELAETAGFTRSTLYRAADQLESAGELDRTTCGKATTWRLFNFDQGEVQNGDRSHETME